jgi:hypothetical protein
MSWFNIRKKKNETPGETPKIAESPAPQTGERTLPPHMQRIAAERGTGRPRRDLTVEEQRALFERQRLALEFDIAQGELASDPENPWTHRIELLTEALETVGDDQAALKDVPPEPYYPLPPTPITDISIERNDAISLGFMIDGHSFEYAETLDWAERGHQISAPEFRIMRADIDAIIPDSVPEDLRGPLRRHLSDSLAVFATDLRDRTIDEAPLPSNPTLADLATKCPTCGGWADWRGRCDACTRRKGREQELRMEQNRLLRERASESEERHRISERLALARRRMADLKTEIAAFERSVADKN